MSRNDNAVELIAISKRFYRKNVLNSISCRFDKGIYGLLGPNGAGKSTLLKCITGLLRVNEGRIIYGENENPQKWKHQIGYLPQKNGVIPDLTVEEHLAFFANLKDVRLTEESRNELLEQVNLLEQRKKKGRTLSGGMTRRLGIAIALMGDPDILLFDEPTAGLDPEERLRFKTIVRNLKTNHIIILSTHIVEDIGAVCDHVLIMDHGTLLFTGTNESVASCAEGKIFLCDAGCIEKTDYVIRYEQLDGGDGARIATTNKRENLKQVEPSIEDGYICVLNNV